LFSAYICWSSPVTGIYYFSVSSCDAYSWSTFQSTNARTLAIEADRVYSPSSHGPISFLNLMYAIISSIMLQSIFTLTLFRASTWGMQNVNILQNFIPGCWFTFFSCQVVNACFCFFPLYFLFQFLLVHKGDIVILNHIPCLFSSIPNASVLEKGASVSPFYMNW
jgi:hypothetical protein